MYDSHSKGISYTAGFFMLIAFAVAGSILAGIISLPVWTSMTGQSFTTMEKGISDPANSNAVKVIQSIAAIFGFFLPTLLTAKLMSRKPFRLLGFEGKSNVSEAGLVIAIMLTALFVSGGFAWLNEQIPITESLKKTFDKMEGDYNKQAEAILSLNNTADYFIALLVMAFLPALCEETLFRGGLQNFLTRATRSIWLSVIVVSILFSIAHFSYYGFLSRVFLGVVLGLIYYFSGKLWLSILAHFVNNALAITAVYVYKLQGKPMAEAMKEGNDTAFWGFMALPVLILLVVLFKKYVKKPEEELPPPGKNEELRNTPFY
ncbi:MAG TPA: type II CAAX endopeptidase family protein [Chitinophagaceae bacterium]|nr:type II CAAX endopeptidase family protein [Chitinophagaceae bacterium]